MENRKATFVKILPVLACFFVMGFCDIVGITSDYVQREFGWSDTMTGFVPSMVFIWFLFLGIPIGNQLNKWGRKNTVMLSLIITIVGMFLPLIDYSSLSCVVAFVLLGIGNAILQVSLNPLLTDIVTEQHLLTSSLTAGQVIKALSSLAGPEIVLIAVGWFGDVRWYYCFPILGVITLVCGLWLFLTPIQEKEQPSIHVSMSRTFGMLKDSKMLLLFLGIFFIVGVDVSTNYISSKLMTMRFDWVESDAKFAPQVYFLCRTIGAFLSIFLLSFIKEVIYFRVNILACLATALVLLFVDNATVNMVCIGGIGFFASSIFSIIYSLALQYKPQEANQVSGLMITAIAGGGIVTPFMGACIEHLGVAGGVLVTLCCILYLTFCAFRISHIKPTTI